MPPSAKKGTARSTVGGKGVFMGAGKSKTPRRHRKIMRETINGITKGDIRRLARRGGVKRISASIYEDLRHAMKAYMTSILRDCCILLEGAGAPGSGGRRTVSVTDVIFALKRRGRPIYGFGVDWVHKKPS